MDGKSKIPLEVIRAPEEFRVHHGLWKVDLLVQLLDYDDKTQTSIKVQYHFVARSEDEVFRKAIRHVPSDVRYKGMPIGLQIFRVQWVAPVTQE